MARSQGHPAAGSGEKTEEGWRHLPSSHRYERKGLRACFNAKVFEIVPFALNDVRMPIPGYIRAIGSNCTKCPGALVTILIAVCIVPGVEVGVSGSLILLMRSHINRAISIDVPIGALPCWNATS